MRCTALLLLSFQMRVEAALAPVAGLGVCRVYTCADAGFNPISEMAPSLFLL